MSTRKPASGYLLKVPCSAKTKLLVKIPRDLAVHRDYDRPVLAKVWELSNSTRAGFLDRTSFHKAMDLISLGQQNMEVKLRLRFWVSESMYESHT